MINGKNYTLTKLLIKKSGLIFGQNKYGTAWIEFRFNGNLIKRFDFWNFDPIKPAAVLPSEEELFIQSLDFTALEQEYFHKSF